MHEIEVFCRSCHHFQLATKGKRGASVRCEKCYEDIVVPAVDQCLECGRTIKPGHDKCKKCEREREAAKSIASRIKTVGSGILTAAIGLFIGYEGVWNALETGVQRMTFGTRSRSAGISQEITREWDPIRFWGGLGFSTLLGVGLVLFALVVVIAGVSGKGQGRLSVGMPRSRTKRAARKTSTD
jgi:hypothetical protein